MIPSFEIKYLELNWYDENTLIKVIESLNALRLEYDEQRKLFKAETTIYPKALGVNKGQLAIRFFNALTEHPYIKMPNGKRNYLSSIIDPETGHIWWIAKEKWLSQQKQWTGVAPNIVGTIQLSLEGQTCEIDINGSDFTLEQLEQYLRTFKNDLWELILDDDSSVYFETEEKFIDVSKSFIDAVNNLVIHANKILETPKVELREIQALKPRKKVRPVKRTFLELATKTNQRLLTSRASESSYNVIENRYILFVLERCYRIINQVVVLSGSKEKKLNDTIINLQKRYDSFSDAVKVNRDLFVADLKLIREHTRLTYWQAHIDEKIKEKEINLYPELSHPDHDIYLKIENKTQGKEGVFVNVWDGQRWMKDYKKFIILNFTANLSELVDIFQHGMMLKINGSYSRTSKGDGCELSFDYISSIQIIDHTTISTAKKSFAKEKNIGITLSENGWIRPISNKELKEQEREKKALINRIGFYSKKQQEYSRVYQKIEPKLRALKKIISSFRGLKIKPSNHFPNSMTFVRNPNYQGVHNSYKVLKKATNLNDEEILVSLEQIDKIGLVNMPILYERWVLVQLILVLKNKLRFTPQSDWKYKLISAIKTNKTDIEIKLEHKMAKRFVSLWYEKTLHNGKRPDFILDVTWAKANVANEPLNFKRFVLDAKFFDKSTFLRAGGMMAKINKLYTDKNYSEGSKNPVFLIHPCIDLIEKPVTAQDWGRYSYLGEIEFNENEKSIFHEKGAIFLSPINRDNFNDELQRLLGLILQYKIENNQVSHNENDKTEAVPICICCGSTKIKELEKSDRYYNKQGVMLKRTSRSVWMQCVECELVQIYNHCGDQVCDNRIIKNGFYWSYHSARAIEPFNIKCPLCSSWGAW